MQDQTRRNAADEAQTWSECSLLLQLKCVVVLLLEPWEAMLKIVQ